MDNITYVLMSEQTAIDRGIIPKNHFFQKVKDNKVIFKKDILTKWLQLENNYQDFVCDFLDSKQALTWI